MSQNIHAQNDEAQATKIVQLQALGQQIHQCVRCVDAGYIEYARPVIGFRGGAHSRILLIGQAAGKLSVARQLPFGGPGGGILSSWFVRAGFPDGFMRTDIYLTALTRCFPGKSPHGKGDRAPSSNEIQLCRPWLTAELAIIQPELIILSGALAIREFLGKGPLDSYIGAIFSKDGQTYLPWPHPSGVSRWLLSPEHQALLQTSIQILSEWRIIHYPEFHSELQPPE